MEGEKPKYISEGVGGAGGSGSGASVPFINNVSTGFPQVQVSRMSLIVDLGLGENAFGLVDPLN